MTQTNIIKGILKNYQNETPAVKSNIVRLLMSGRLAGTGKLFILPVDQGFEHGPVISFSINEQAFDPEYHITLASEAKLSAYAAPKGMIEAISNEARYTLPLIMKMNSGNQLYRESNQPYQAITATIQDALYQGCTAVGYTIYPGSDFSLKMIAEISEQISEAKAKGLAVIVWSYPRGGDVSKKGETALDVTCYAAHIASLIGAHIIKVKLPQDYIEKPESKKLLVAQDFTRLDRRVAYVMNSCFSGKRLVVFSGGKTKDKESILTEIEGIKKGGGNGSIMGRNIFQRPRLQALKLLDEALGLYMY